MEWVPVPIHGSIYSWTRTWHRFAGAETLGRPYVTVSVSLPQAGGTRLLGLLDSGDDVRIGMGVTGEVRSVVVFDREVPAITWRPEA